MILLPHLETNISLACQNTCVGCNHFVGMQAPSYADPAIIERDIVAFGKVAHAKKYALIGGEPLLHKEIVDILSLIRNSGITDWVEVWTNGQHARKMPAAFWKGFDELVVSRYPGKLTDQDIEFMRKKCDTYGARLTVRDGKAFFTALLYRRTANDHEAAYQYRQCWYRTYTHVLDNGYFYRCCTSPFVAPLILNLPEGTDGLALDGITENKLRAYLAQEETPRGCYRCGAHNGRHIGWRETSRENWLKESMA